MPASRSVRTTGALVVAGLVALGGAACTSSSHPEADGQSVAAACATLADTAEQAMTAFTEADAADPAAAAQATAEVRDDLAAAVTSIGNARVEAVAADLRAGFDVLAEATAAASKGDVAGATGLADATDRIRTGLAEYHDLCSG